MEGLDPAVYLLPAGESPVPLRRAVGQPVLIPRTAERLALRYGATWRP